MLCLQCKNRNPVGNKFCRECGAKLAVPQDVLAAEEAARAEVERTQERVARLLTDARLLAEQSKMEQAILLTEEAAEQMPSSSSAHALLATLYERTGSSAKAVAAMERVVALNPESEADKATLLRLKVLESANPEVRLLARAQTPEMSRPTAAQSLWLPVAAAGIAGAFVLGVGLSVVNNRNADASAQRGTVNNFPGTTQVARSEGIAGTQTPSPDTPAGQMTVTNTVPGAGTTTSPKISLPPPADSSLDPFTSQNPAGAVTNARTSAQTSAPAVNRRTPSFSAATSGLPLPSGLARNTTLGPAPVKLIGVPTSTNKASAPQDFGQGGRMTVGAPPAGTPETISAAAPQSTATPQGDGYIRISVRPPRAPEGSTSPNSRAVPGDSSDSTSGAFLRAQSQQGSGLYREAITSYQMSVNSDPGSAGEAYQGMGFCYKNLSDKGSAAAAYRNAISAYERQGGSAAQRGIASCKAALEDLGG